MFAKQADGFASPWMTADVPWMCHGQPDAHSGSGGVGAPRGRRAFPTIEASYLKVLVVNGHPVPVERAAHVGYTIAATGHGKRLEPTRRCSMRTVPTCGMRAGSAEAGTSPVLPSYLCSAGPIACQRIPRRTHTRVGASRYVGPAACMIRLSE
jgi:hypothetical protein